MPKWLQYCVMAALFVVAAGATVFVIQKFRKTESTAPIEQRGSLDDIPGLAGGDVVKLPKLPTLKNDFVDLSTVDQKYLLCVFISTECEGCSEDERFWKDLLPEVKDKNVGFYVISVDTDQTKVQTFAKTYGFEDLPVLFDPQKQAIAAFKIQFVPQYVLLTNDGKVITRWNGIRRYDPNRQKPIEKLDGLREFVASSVLVH